MKSNEAAATQATGIQVPHLPIYPQPADPVNTKFVERNGHTIPRRLRISNIVDEKGRVIGTIPWR